MYRFVYICNIIHPLSITTRRYRTSMGVMGGGSSDSEHGDHGAGMGSMSAAADPPSASEGGDLDVRYRASLGCMAGGSSESDECSDAASVGFRCAEPEPVLVGSDDEALPRESEFAAKEEPVEERGLASSSVAGLAAHVARGSDDDAFSECPAGKRARVS